MALELVLVLTMSNKIIEICATETHAYTYIVHIQHSRPHSRREIDGNNDAQINRHEQKTNYSQINSISLI